MKKIIIAVAVMFSGIAAFAQNTGNLLENYFPIKNALINSDGKAAAVAISHFHELVKRENNFAQKADLLKASVALSKAGTDLEKQRTAFNGLSAAMWKLVKDADKVNHPVYYQYCPMKKTNWLSSEKDIKNPYYGAAMLTCGKVVDTKS